MEARQVFESKRGRAQRSRMAGAGGRRGGRGRLGLDLGHGLREERGGSAQDGGRAVSQHPGGLSFAVCLLGVCVFVYSVFSVFRCAVSCMPACVGRRLFAVVLSVEEGTAGG